MTDTSSSPRWWDFDEFSSAKPSEAQRGTRDAQPVDPVPGVADASLAAQVDPAYSDAAPTDEFLASLPDDMAEAELEVAGYATTPPAEDQAVPPPPAAAEGGDWVLPSMPGFAADLPTPPAPQAADSAHIDLPDAADWAAEAEAAEQGLISDDAGAGLADWDIPAVPGLHDADADADDLGAAYAVADAEGSDAPAFAEEDAAVVDEDEDVEYIPGTWSEDGGSWSQEGEEKRWTGADGGGSVVSTDMPEWMYEGPSTADEGWDEYEAYEAAVAEHEAATESPAHDDATPADAEDYWAEQAAEPVAVAPVPTEVDDTASAWDADQSWDAVSDDDATSWDLPTHDDAADWNVQTEADATAATVEGDAMSWAAADTADAQAWDIPAADAAVEDAPADWMAADEPAGVADSDDTPISWEDINTWADESELAHQADEPAADAGMAWGTTAQDPADWDAQDAASWTATSEPEDTTEGWVTPSADTEGDHDATGVAGWDLPDVTAEAEADAAGDDGLFVQPDAFGAVPAPEASDAVEAPASEATADLDWQVTDTESSWASADQDTTPAWATPEEDTTTSWTTGEADVTPAWGAEPAGDTQWAEADGDDTSWDVPAPPAPGAMSFAAQSDDVLADPLSAEGDAPGFLTAGDQLPPPPPVGGSVPMAPEDLPEWMRPDEPDAEAEAIAAPLAEVSEEEAVAEEIAAPFNPVIAGVEDGPAAKVQDPGLITAPIPEDELPPPPGEAPPVRPTWGQPGPSGIGPAPITSPTLSHPVPEGGEQSFAMPPAGKAGKGSSLKRILIAVLAALLFMGGAYAAWEFYIRDTFFATAGGVSNLAQGNSSVTFSAEADNQVEWKIDVPKNEAFALTMETPAGIQVGFVAQNAEGQAIGAANTLDDGRSGYRFVAQNDVDGPITLTAKASDSISADLNMRIVPFAGTTDTVDGVQWNVTVPADQSAIINVLTRGTNPNVVISTADGTEIGSSESFQSQDDENMYNAQFKVPAQAAEQAIVITLKTDQAYDATSTLIVDLHK